MEKRVISTQAQEEDQLMETSLRPQRLEEYIGQEKVKKMLKVYIEAARQRGESLDHVLLYGPPGLGKKGGYPSGPGSGHRHYSPWPRGAEDRSARKLPL